MTTTDADSRTFSPHPRALKILRPRNGISLLQGTSGLELPLETKNLLQQVDRLASARKATRQRRWTQQLESWLETADRRTADATGGLECLAWCHALPLISLPQSALHELVDYLATLPQQPAAVGQPLRNQLIAGELPWTLACLFPNRQPYAALAERAGKFLSASVCDLLDGNGMPAAQHLPILRPLLASWTRCSLLARGLRKQCFAEEAMEQLQWMTRQMLRLTRADGSAIFSSHRESCGELVASSLRQFPDDESAFMASRLLAPDRRRPKSRLHPVDEPPLGVYSEWSAVAVMRNVWSRDGAQFAVAFPRQDFRMELNASQTTLWSGWSTLQLHVDDQRLSAAGDWEEICWFADDDVQYLELELSLEAGWKVQRQLCLAQGEEFLYMADAITGPRPARIDYRCTFPLGERMKWKPGKDSTEGFLAAQRPLSLVLPIALPEWRSSSTNSSLQCQENALTLSQQATAQRLYAPLFVDLNRRRLRQPFTWRQLTVAEQLEVVGRDVAVGYRVQVGSDQWVIYRSLAECGNRTLLGLNISNEFLLGRFGRDGEIDELVEVEYQ